MGAKAWMYFVPYQEEINSALQNLRSKEFQYKRYLGSELNPRNIEEAFANAAPIGTASILDIFEISEQPKSCCASSLTKDELMNFFGTDRPTKNKVKNNEKIWEYIDRGTAIYIFIYKKDELSEICFAGYSFD